MARKSTSVAIIGAGVVGRTLGKALADGGYSVVAVGSRSSTSVRDAVAFIGQGRAARSLASAAKPGDVVLITTSDGAIRSACEAIAAEKGFKRGSVVIHVSGALSSSELASARQCKAHVASLHPLQSFPSPEEGLKRLKGTIFTFEGDAAAEPVAAGLVRALGGRMIPLDASSKALYHAACCVISNYVVSIADLGTVLLELSGLSRKDACRAAVPLLTGTVRNIADIGSPAALTGPIARGDAETIERHLAALRPLPRDIRRLYCEMGLYTVRVAQRKGTLDGATARHLLHMLSLGSRTG